MLYDHCLQRPDTFDLNVHAPLAHGLVLAGLGRFVSTTHYRDSSLHGNHGTLTNMIPATDWVWDSTLGRCRLSFSGSQYVTLGDVDVLDFGTGDFTVSAWAFPTGADARRTIVAKGGTGDWLFYRNNGQWRFYGQSGAFDCNGSSVVVNAWIHLCVTRNGNVGRLYENGNLVATDADVSATNFGNVTAFTVGAYAGGTDRFWVGNLSDVLIYSGVGIGQNQIQQLADPSNVMLSGLLLPPTRRFWPVAVSGEETPDLLLPHHGMMAM